MIHYGELYKTFILIPCPPTSDDWNWVAISLISGLAEGLIKKWSDGTFTIKVFGAKRNWLCFDSLEDALKEIENSEKELVL